IVPRLVRRFAEEAPYVDIRVVPANRMDIIRQLGEGGIDIVIGCFATVPERFGRMKLIDEEYVFVVRAGHPLTSGVPTVERLHEFGHVAVNYVGCDVSLQDGFLPELGVLRRVHMEVTALEAPQRLGKDVRIAVCVPHFWCVPPIVVGCDLIASVPKALAIEFSKYFQLATIPDPEGSRVVAVEAIWDRQKESDPATMWLRDQIGWAVKQAPP